MYETTNGYEYTCDFTTDKMSAEEINMYIMGYTITYILSFNPSVLSFAL